MSKSFAKLREFVRSPLSRTPGSYRLQIDLLVTGDVDRGAQALAIIPMIEGREAITARIGRGQRPYAGASNLVDDGSMVYVGADAYGPGGKFEAEDHSVMPTSVDASA